MLETRLAVYEVGDWGIMDYSTVMNYKDTLIQLYYLEVAVGMLTRSLTLR